jgi:hypothetical protein
MVSVGIGEVSSEEGSGVAHSLQNLESEGFSVLHFGHLLSMIRPNLNSEKEYQ